jgi:hypothetical protein
MNKKKNFIPVFTLTLTAASLIFLIFNIFMVKKPVVWTKENSLRPTAQEGSSIPA